MFSWLCNDFAMAPAVHKWPEVLSSLTRLVGTLQVRLPATRVIFLVGGERALFPYAGLPLDYDEFVGCACELLVNHNFAVFRGVEWMRRMTWKDNIGHIASPSIPLWMDMWEAHLPYARPPEGPGVWASNQ